VLASRILAAAACAVVAAGLTSLFPITIDGNLDCGGLTGRVAIIGSYNSSGGEPSAEDVEAAAEATARCEAKARKRLAGSVVIGGTLGLAVLMTWERKNRWPRAALRK
jgi:hypothetical protein